MMEPNEHVTVSVSLGNKAEVALTRITAQTQEVLCIRNFQTNEHIRICPATKKDLDRLIENLERMRIHCS